MKSDKTPQIQIMKRPDDLSQVDLMNIVHFIKENNPHLYEIEGYKILDDHYASIPSARYFTRKIGLLSLDGTREIVFYINFSREDYLEKTDQLAQDETHYSVTHTDGEYLEIISARKAV